MSRIGNTIETESRLMVARDHGGGRGEKGMGRDSNGHGVSFRGDENVLELDSGDGCPTL